MPKIADERGTKKEKGEKSKNDHRMKLGNNVYR